MTPEVLTPFALEFWIDTVLQRGDHSLVSFDRGFAGDRPCPSQKLHREYNPAKAIVILQDSISRRQAPCVQNRIILQ